MYRNSEHYADPTAGRALAHVFDDERHKRRSQQHVQQIVNHKRTPASMKCFKRKKKATRSEERIHYRYVHVWDSPMAQEARKNAV